MAILESELGIEVEIIVNNKAATEYKDSIPTRVDHHNETAAFHQQMHTVSNYIQALDNELFSVKLSVFPPYSTKTPQGLPCSKLAFDIFLDGVLLWTHHYTRPATKKNGNYWEAEIKGHKKDKAAKCRERKFRFAKLDIVSPGEGENDFGGVEGVRSMGMIEVKVHQTNYGKKGGDTPLGMGFLGRNVTTVSEATLKGNLDAKSHRTVLDYAEKKPRGEVHTTTKFNEDFPVAIFQFRYRSLEALKQLGIIPRTPSPEASRESSPSLFIIEEATESPDPVEQTPVADEEDPAAMRARIKELEAALARAESRSKKRRIKKEDEDEDEESSNSGNSPPAKRARTVVEDDVETMNDNQDSSSLPKGVSTVADEDSVSDGEEQQILLVDQSES